MSVPTVVRMANQIGEFFAAYPEEEAIEGIAGHLGSFWDPRMRRQVYAQLAEAPGLFDDLVRRALRRLQERDPAGRTPAPPAAAGSAPVSPPA